MAYEELEFPAIQNKSMKDFPSRFRIFSSKDERDVVMDMIRRNQENSTKYSPVMLKIIVRTDENNQLSFDLKESNG